MKLVETKYEVTLKKSDGSELHRVPMKWDGVYMNGKKMWAIYYEGGFYQREYCVPVFYEANEDVESLFNAGYYKVIKIEKIDTYEERTEI